MNPVRRVIIVSPSQSTTGGVELLHQLAHELNTIGHSARLLYYPFGKEHKTPSAFSTYNADPISVSEICAQDIVILPETFTHLIGRFRDSLIVVWWLSVDNYFGSRKLLYAVKNRFSPFDFRRIERSGDFRAVSLHLYQSEYARAFLEKNGISNCLSLSDYINDAFLEAGERVDLSKKSNAIAFNPAKGLSIIKTLMASFPEFQFLPIRGLTRDEMMALLASTKLYVDFGNHPGKDRIPREAAAMSCVVVTNRSGSAGFSADVGISDFYKLDNSADDFLLRFWHLAMSVFDEFTFHHAQQHAYRDSLKLDRRRFSESAAVLMERLGANN